MREGNREGLFVGATILGSDVGLVEGRAVGGPVGISVGWLDGGKLGALNDKQY